MTLISMVAGKGVKVGGRAQFWGPGLPAQTSLICRRYTAVLPPPPQLAQEFAGGSELSPEGQCKPGPY